MADDVKCVHSSTETYRLTEGKQVSKQSSSSHLSPINKNGIVRVGGRLQKSMWNFSEKHPGSKFCWSSLVNQSAPHRKMGTRTKNNSFLQSSQSN